MQADAHIERQARFARHLGHARLQRQCETGGPLRMIVGRRDFGHRSLPAGRDSADRHVGVAYRLDPLYAVRRGQSVEVREEPVEQLHQLRGRQAVRQRRETDQVGEDDADLAMRIGDRRFAAVDPIDDLAGQHAVQQVLDPRLGGGDFIEQPELATVLVLARPGTVQAQHQRRSDRDRAGDGKPGLRRPRHRDHREEGRPGHQREHREMPEAQADDEDRRQHQQHDAQAGAGHAGLDAHVDQGQHRRDQAGDQGRREFVDIVHPGVAHRPCEHQHDRHDHEEPEHERRAGRGRIEHPVRDREKHDQHRAGEQGDAGVMAKAQAIEIAKRRFLGRIVEAQADTVGEAGHRESPSTTVAARICARTGGSERACYLAASRWSRLRPVGSRESRYPRPPETGTTMR